MMSVPALALRRRMIDSSGLIRLMNAVAISACTWKSVSSLASVSKRWELS